MKTSVCLKLSNLDSDASTSSPLHFDLAPLLRNATAQTSVYQLENLSNRFVSRLANCATHVARVETFGRISSSSSGFTNS